MNLQDIKEQWEYVAALPKDENGLTNPYEGITFEEYETTVLPELMMHENPVGMPKWFVPETYVKEPSCRLHDGSQVSRVHSH